MRQWKSKIRPVTPALLVIKQFGGLAKTARAAGKGVSTVQRWLDSGFIPSRHQADLLAAAAREGIDLDPTLFVPKPADAAA